MFKTFNKHYTIGAIVGCIVGISMEYRHDVVERVFDIMFTADQQTNSFFNNATAN